MKHALALAAALLLAACTPDAEQHAHPRQSSGNSPSPILPSQDRDFLEKAGEGSNAEIEVGRLALSRGLRPEVKAFGQRMVIDHAALKQRLNEVAAKHRIVLPTSLGDQQASYDRLVDLRYDRFDVEFVRAMIEDHAMAAELFRNEAAGGADPDIRAVATQSLPLIRAHLEHARSLRTATSR